MQKRFLILTGIIALTCTVARAAQVCVQTQITCNMGSPDAVANHSNWDANCTTSDGKNLTIGVVASCASENVGETAEYLPHDSYNTYCYCKMIRPAESLWVFEYDYSYESTGTNCQQNCGGACLAALTVSKTLAPKLFANIK